MRILVAPDSFKGSLSSQKAAAIMARAAYLIFPQAEITLCPLADGGEGTLRVIEKLLSAKRQRVTVFDPLCRERNTWWLKQGETAYLELAQAAGLTLVSPQERNPLKTTTFGVGQMLRKAAESGCQEIYLGVGGSATNDGGIGALTALGVRFIDRFGRLIWPGKGEDLERIGKIDLAGLPKEWQRIRVTVLTDVRNGLTGPEGAAAVYAPQKGASPDDVKRLEHGLKHYAKLVKRSSGVSMEKIPGAGAAGGIAGGLYAFLGAKIVSGVETILKLSQFEDKLKGTDLVLTGEGKLDYQVGYGKALSAVFLLAEKYQVPVIVFAGSISPEAYRMFQKKPVSLFSIMPSPVSLKTAMQEGETFLYHQVQQVLRVYGYGRKKQEV
ncbi:MAG: glycerate kinase [Candidatus Omnitrophica bacterium]|nr:glycerate kinase [Candidatus Omnitrophota bacterium]